MLFSKFGLALSSLSQSLCSFVQHYCVHKCIGIVSVNLSFMCMSDVLLGTSLLEFVYRTIFPGNMAFCNLCSIIGRVADMKT